MKFDVLITGIGNPKARNIVSKHIAHETGVSIQVALSQLDTLPVPYASGLGKDEAQMVVRQLNRIQVTAHLVEAQPSMAPQRGSYLGDKPFVKMPEPPKPAPQPPHKQEPDAAPVAPQRLEVTTRKKVSAALWWAAGALAVILVVFAATRGVFNWNHAFALDWSKSGLAQGDNARRTPAGKPAPQDAQDTLAKSDSSAADSQRQMPRGAAPDTASPPPEQAQMAEAFLDSAQAAATLRQAIAFYKFATSFNRKNVAAWRGLRDSYERAGMEREQRDAEREMAKLFGNDVFSIAKVVEPYGTILSLATTADGTFRVEYRARKAGDGNALLDAYHLMRDLAPPCKCSAISLYAKTGQRAGLLVYARTESLSQTFERFKNDAQVTVLK
jgi:hypothetical protein